MFEDIQVFCAIAKHQSFAKAARELGLSKPVVTRRLSRLESSLSTRLLNRTTRQVTLTEAGNQFYSDVDDILQALEISKENVKTLTSHVTGTLKVGLATSFSNYYVSRSLNSFLKEHPNLKVQIVVGNHLLNLLGQGFDLVIQCGQLPNSNYHYKKMGVMKKIICASPEYLQAHGAPKIPADLIKHNCLDANESFHHSWAIQENGKPNQVQVRGNVNVNNGADLKNLAVDGVGIVNLAHYLVKEELKNGKLVSILNEFQLQDHTLYAVYPTNKFLSKKTQLFVNFVTKLLSEVCVEKCS